MAAGRKPAPAALQLVKGTGDGKDSGGRPIKTPPKFKRIAPSKPDSMSEQASLIWDEIVSALEALNILKEIDGAALEMACETYARWYEARQERISRGITAATTQGVGVAPWVRVEESAGKEFRAWCAEFGLTPSAEMKIAKDVSSGGDGEGDNPFAGS